MKTTSLFWVMAYTNRKREKHIKEGSDGELRDQHANPW